MMLTVKAEAPSFCRGKWVFSIVFLVRKSLQHLFIQICLQIPQC